eukprot:jgi/Mesvir1/17328/Mv07722-RA.1
MASTHLLSSQVANALVASEVHSAVPIAREARSLPVARLTCDLASRTAFIPSRHTLGHQFGQSTKQTRAWNSKTVTAQAAPTASVKNIAGVFFDCDGTLCDTERDGHRVAFNQAFAQMGLDTVWDVELYGELLKIGGGKERMTHHFNNVGWPSQMPADAKGRQEFIARLHKLKTSLFAQMIEDGKLPLRPGVARLVHEVIDAGIPIAVCSTSNEQSVSAIVRLLLGQAVFDKMTILAGDVVPKKKPDPAIYNLIRDKLGVNPAKCVVVEDSHIGLLSAKAAGMKCVVTKSGYTADEDFSKADAVYDCIGDGKDARFSLVDLARLVT